MASAAGRRRASMSARTSIAAAARAAGIMGDASDARTARPQGTAIPSFASEKMSPAAPIGPDVARVDNPIIHTGELDTFSRLRIEVEFLRWLRRPPRCRRSCIRVTPSRPRPGRGPFRERWELQWSGANDAAARRPPVPLARRGTPAGRSGCTAPPPHRIGRRDNRNSRDCIRADRRWPPGRRATKPGLSRQWRSGSSRGFSCWSSGQRYERAPTPG